MVVVNGHVALPSSSSLPFFPLILIPVFYRRVSPCCYPQAKGRDVVWQIKMTCWYAYADLQALFFVIARRFHHSTFRPILLVAVGEGHGQCNEVQVS